MSLQEPSPDFSITALPKALSDKKAVSERKIQANRQNALRSTGPTTARGKHNVSRNAITHGLLAREVVITDGEGKENLKEFHDLVEKLREEYEPVGVVEEQLVETIATCWWRKARVLRAENGEIRKRLDAAATDRDIRNSDKSNFAQALLRNLGVEFSPDDNETEKKLPSRERWSAMQVAQIDLRGHASGLTFLRSSLENAKSEFASKGYISKFTRKEIFNSFYFCDWTLALLCFQLLREEDKREQGQSEETVDEQTGVEPALAVSYIDEVLERISNWERCATKRENMAVDAEARSFSLPPVEATDKLLRYESHLDRQLYRAMDQLERLQRQRRGEAVLPPLNINLGGEK